jgi:hypothetical protein
MIAFEQPIKMEAEGHSQKKDAKTLNNEFSAALQARLEICRTCIEGYMRSIAFKKKSPFYRRVVRPSFQGIVNTSNQCQRKGKTIIH